MTLNGQMMIGMTGMKIKKILLKRNQQINQLKQINNG
jgi:hypothetical protein